jgi:histidyl-tRNA synthetase
MGCSALETPTLEPLSLCRAIGEDESCFSFEDQGGRSCFTVRSNCPHLPSDWPVLNGFSFRRYQIQSAFRAEKPQKGRYREFTQFDLDIFGVASPLADAEVIAVTLDMYQTLGFKNVKAIINNRDLMQDIPYTAIVAIDKLKKIGKEGVIKEMVSKGLSVKQAQKYLEKVKNLQPDQTINIIFDYLQKSGFSPNFYRFEPTLARSFSYSQGPIWEIIIPEYRAGSVAGGERYDALNKKISGQKLPATGIALGLIAL